MTESTVSSHPSLPRRGMPAAPASIARTRSQPAAPARGAGGIPQHRSRTFALSSPLCGRLRVKASGRALRLPAQAEHKTFPAKPTRENLLSSPLCRPPEHASLAMLSRYAKRSEQRLAYPTKRGPTNDETDSNNETRHDLAHGRPVLPVVGHGHRRRDCKAVQAHGEGVHS